MSASEPRPQYGDAATSSTALGSPSDVSHFATVLDEYVHLRGIGREPDRAEFLARHAGIAHELAACLDGLDLVLSAQEDLRASSDSDDASSVGLPPATQLGDYLIIREVGRGGMGVVYEAEQLSLGRRVALKVLPSAASLDSRQRQRFLLEAQAVALLQHDNIVPVYAVGCDEGLHYYAMQFIDGRSLAEVIRDLRAADRPEAAGLPDGRSLGSDPLSDVTPVRQQRSFGSVPSTVASQRPNFYRTAAWYGVQAAEALQHAHVAGVIHRDIKPSNLIVDARGRLWVTDFGVARLPQDDPSITRTGDLVGTLRYMSPEQVRGARHEIDAGTDIYALGLTLYELLTLRPAFVAADRQELLRRILQDEPVAPGRINRSIPRDLETIILKAIAKESPARYGSARELADDLGRFLDDQPIQARRPNLLERASRWSRRHRSVVLTAASVLLIALSVSTFLLWKAKRRTDAEMESHREDLVDQRLAYEQSFIAIDQITQAFTSKDGNPEPLRGTEADRVYRFAIAYYDSVARTSLKHPLVSEVSAKASRRSGFYRLILGDGKGRKDYDRAIRTYEQLAAESPERIWLRTGLIETLREYSHRLSLSGDATMAGASTRRALRVADGLIGNKNVASPCYHKALIEPVNGLAWELVARPPTDPSDLSLAIRLARQVVEWESSKWPFWPAVHVAHRTLGVAYCRAGDWPAAAAALESSVALNDGGDPRDWFFLAIARQRMGDTAGATRWYVQAVSRMAQNSTESRDPELCRFQAEAGAVVGRTPPGSITELRDPEALPPLQLPDKFDERHSVARRGSYNKDR